MMKTTKTIWVVAVTLGLLVGSTSTVLAQSEEEVEPSPAAIAASAAPATESGNLQPPPDLAGIDWADVSVFDGAEIEATSNEGTLAQWEALLAATGATYGQAGQLNAQAVDREGGEPIGTYSAIRIVGADEDVLREAMLGVFREGLDPDEYTFEESDERAAVYVHGDIAHLVDLPDEQLNAILAALP